MAVYAQIEDNIVVNIVVAESSFIQSMPGEWVLSCSVQGGPPVRKNYANIGSTYDRARNAFIPLKPYNSWILNEDTCLWDSPIPYPKDGKNYFWAEESKNWIEGSSVV